MKRMRKPFSLRPFAGSVPTFPTFPHCVSTLYQLDFLLELE